MIDPVILPGTPLSVFQPLSPEKQKKTDETKQALQQALQTAKQIPGEAKAQRQAAAQQKITRIKEAIKALRQMPGMDPKSVARMIARLARELARAVGEYKATGGTEAIVSGNEAVSSAIPTTEEQAGSMPGAGFGGLPGAEEMPAFQRAVTSYARGQETGFSSQGRQARDNGLLREVSDIYETMKALLEAQRQRLKHRRTVHAENPHAETLKPENPAFAEADKGLLAVKQALARVAAGVAGGMAAGGFSF